MECPGLRRGPFANVFQDVNARYGFKEDMETLFGPVWGLDVWQRIGSVFDLLPLAAMVDGSVFCAHGGIPRAPPGDDDRFDILHDTERWRVFQNCQNQMAMLQVQKWERAARVIRRLQSAGAGAGAPPPPPPPCHRS